MISQKEHLPDFLIIGAAKAGTTSLHNYLNKSRHIFMSFPKEPKYFSYSNVDVAFSGPGDNLVKKEIIKNFEAYCDLFPVKDKLKGESSADNLYYYKYVIPAIKANLNDPVIMIILRNPIERAFSAYTHLRRDDREKNDFETGLELEDFRINQGYEFIWHYKKAGLYYNQVKAYIENFSKCKIFLFEDLKNDAQKVVNGICDILNIPYFSINSKKIYHQSGIPKNNWKTYFYRNILVKDNIVKENIKIFLPQIIRKKIREKLSERFFNNNLLKLKMNPESKNVLIEYFREDILKLQDLINRDLTAWLK